MVASSEVQGVPPDVERVAVAFARFLRAEGLVVPMSSTLLFVDALQQVGIATRNAVYWAGRATLVRRPEDIPVYDRVFDALWMRGRYESRDEGDVEHLTIATDEDNDDDESDAPEGDDQGDDVITVRFSTTEERARKPRRNTPKPQATRPEKAVVTAISMATVAIRLSPSSAGQVSAMALAETARTMAVTSWGWQIVPRKL